MADTTKQLRNLIIIENIPVSDNYFILKCSDNTPIPTIYPGQFAHIKIDNNPQVFLRRPFSIHDYDNKNNTVSFLIKIMGNGSKALSKLNKDAIINTILPLGNRFSIDKASEGKSLLIGGGVGIAPIYFLAKKMHENNYKFDILIGGKSKNDLLCRKQFETLSNTFITTEDGSEGTKGFVINHHVIDNIQQYKNIFCCGPNLMMKAIAAIARENNIFCEVSLENKMACGFGVCLCCVTATINGNKCICKNGPVFNINELLW